MRLNLIRKEALKKHREMWNKIAELLESGVKLDNSVRYKTYALELLGVDIDSDDRPYANCYCCEASTGCRNCLVVWGGSGDITCDNPDFGEYWMFVALIRSEDYRLAAEIARKIANLPERDRYGR